MKHGKRKHQQISNEHRPGAVGVVGAGITRTYTAADTAPQVL